MYRTNSAVATADILARLGIGSVKTSMIPVCIREPAWGSQQVSGLSLGGRHVLVWTDSGEIYGFGVKLSARRFQQ